MGKRIKLLYWLSIFAGLYIIISTLTGCSLMPKVIRQAEKPASEALSMEAESKLTTDVQFIPATFRCPDCGEVSDSEGAAMITRKDLAKKFVLDMSHEGAKYTWWQKVLRWLWGLGIIGLILVIVLFCFAPGILGGLLGRIRPARSFKRVVAALENAKIRDNAAAVSFLSAQLKEKDKKRIRKWRAKGKI